MAASLSVRDVSVVFGGLRAVDALSFEVAAGAIKGVIGPNGAGKTTLFNAIAGAGPLSQGQVLLDGVELAQLRSHQRAALGVTRTFQNLQIFREMTVLENVMMGGYVGTRAGWLAGLFGMADAEERASEAAAREHLAWLGLEGRAGELAANLGFADAKLLEIARALAAKPKLLLLDEPIAGVPLADQDRIAQVIRRVNAAGVTILLVEHNMRMVMNLCSDILVMHHGQRLAEGDAATISRHPDVIAAYLGVAAHA